MSTSGWGVDLTVVAGADLSSSQFKFVNESGVLATSETNPAGILQNKPAANEHGAVRFEGVSKLVMAASVGPGVFIGQSNVTSGLGAIVTSGGFAFGRTRTGCDSGMLATVWIFGGPVYVAK